MFLLFSTLKIFSSVTKVSIDHMKLFITCRFFILPSEPPTFVKKPPSKIIVDKGSVLSLCCEAVGSPPPKVEWLRAGNVRSTDTSLPRTQHCWVQQSREICLPRKKSHWIGRNNNVSSRQKKRCLLINNMICYYSSYQTLISYQSERPILSWQQHQ